MRYWKGLGLEPLALLTSSSGSQLHTRAGVHPLPWLTGCAAVVAAAAVTARKQIKCQNNDVDGNGKKVITNVHIM